MGDDDNDTQRSSRLDLEKEERAKARWTMLRNALLKKKNGGADDDVISSSNYSINAFPGFNLLDRTIFNSSTDNDGDTPPTTTTATNRDDHEYHLVRNSYTPNSRTNANPRPMSFITRETSIIDPFSHVKYNGIDNTGNVRVWDAESALAAFLLSIILDDYEDIVELLKAKIDENDTADEHQRRQGIVNLRRDIRSMIMTRPRTFLLRDNSSSSNPQSSLSDDACNILELGSGQAGLVALAMTNMAHLYNGTDIIKSLSIVITDGHPTCVANNKVCARLVSSISSSINGSSSSSSRVSLQVESLCWDSSIDAGGETCQRINKLVDNENWITNTNTTTNTKNKEEEEDQHRQRPAYHLVLASDCTHFTNYHDGLLLTIARTLIVGGVALLCQPRRGTTLDEFMTLIAVVNNTNNNNNNGIGPLFRMTMYEEFHAKITTMHKSLMMDKEGGSIKSNADDEDDTSVKSLLERSYDPNRHLPLLLVLVKLRPYDETIDGDIVRGYHNDVKMRS